MRADLEKVPDQVSAMFDDVAARYDLTNLVVSLGNAPLWRIVTTRAVAPRAGQRILDVAAGTGTSSASLARAGAQIVAVDFSPGMIAVGRERLAGIRNIEFVEADAAELPFEDNSFDAVSISFGLRNVAEPRKALREFHRVTKPGGRLVVCEFSHPNRAPVRLGNAAYQATLMPLLAKLTSSNDSAYEYLHDSIQHWPDQRRLAGWISAAGWRKVAWRNITFGVVALHRGFKELG